MKKYTISQHFDGNLTREIIASNEEDAMEQFNNWFGNLSSIELHEALDLQADSTEIDSVESVEFGGELEFDPEEMMRLHDDYEGDVAYDDYDGRR